MNVTPKTAARQITVAARQRAEVSRVRLVATKERLAYSTSSWDSIPEPVSMLGDVDDAHCFVCGRHTDHFAEHDQMVEDGYARYEDDGSVTWTEKGWNEFRA